MKRRRARRALFIGLQRQELNVDLLKLIASACGECRGSNTPLEKSFMAGLIQADLAIKRYSPRIETSRSTDHNGGLRTGDT